MWPWIARPRISPKCRSCAFALAWSLTKPAFDVATREVPGGSIGTGALGDSSMEPNRIRGWVSSACPGGCPSACRCASGEGFFATGLAAAVGTGDALPLRRLLALSVSPLRAAGLFVADFLAEAVAVVFFAVVFFAVVFFAVVFFAV